LGRTGGSLGGTAVPTVVVVVVAALDAVGDEYAVSRRRMVRVEGEDNEGNE
jgi:hypothetical protein